MTRNQVNHFIVGKVDMKDIRINFWDLGGQLELQSLWEKYYSESHAIVFVVDSTDKARIDQVRQTFEKVVQNEIVEGVPVLMLANKQDVPDALHLQDIQSIFNKIAVQLEARDSKVLEISALKGYNLIKHIQ